MVSLIIREVGNETFAMHRLVQLSVHVWLERRNEKRYYEKASLTLFASELPGEECGNTKLCESLFPHPEVALRYDLDSESSILRRSELLYNIGCFEFNQGRYGMAYQKCLESYKLHCKSAEWQSSNIGKSGVGGVGTSWAGKV